MKYAIIDAKGRVENVILLEDDAGYIPVDGRALRPLGTPQEERVSPGWRWDEVAGFRPPTEAFPATVAGVVRKARLMEALDLVGRRAEWETAVAAAKQATRDYWACEPEIARSNPKMQRVAAKCGIGWDDLFDRAAQL
jgi:hypothetical protein